MANINFLNPSITSGSSDSSGKTEGWIDTAQNDTFFTKYDIKPERWDQVFPYRLLVIDVSQNNAVVLGTGQQDSDDSFQSEFAPNA